MILRHALLLLLPLVAAACSTKHDLPEASGPLRPLNAGRWTPGPNELTTPPVVPRAALPAPGGGDRA